MDNKQRERGIYRVTLLGGAANLALVVFKFVAGIVGGSSAMLADAVHSLSDFVTDVIVIVFVRVSGKPRDTNHDFGHGKFETFATLLIGFILLLVGVGIAWNGVSDIMHVVGGGTLPRPGMIALVAAVVSIAIKEWLYHYTIRRGRQLESDAVVANAWHHRSDAFSSLATLIGIGGAIVLGERWTVLDPVAAVFVSIFIIFVAGKLMKPSIDELLERSLPGEIESEIERIALSLEGVREPHNLRTRKIGNIVAIELHVRMDGDVPLARAHDTATHIEQKLKKRFGAGTHVIIHVEPYK